MMQVLTIVKTLNLPDWWVCAGFVRSKIWDRQHGYDRASPLPDVDVIYFDSDHINEDEEVRLENQLKNIDGNFPWSVKNQARMHVLNDSSPYESSVDAISKFPETATSLGLKLDEDDHLILVAPHGLDDAFKMKLRPTPHFMNNERSWIYEKRIVEKNWNSKWPNIEITS
ncbi:nucleotidyltransferase family protein [Guptibacillus algicola]|uniref:nucleotidyltransferase family protein n=1 Tax=Guptibacillus algicola TaxID=225844 RepID=UPI001CD54FCD|nr:nucleotidyltransferase family protein [Alkalihalobacillus algicola]MCA0987525.1 nucleotidyltransferase family protein [Alkalihalobacillus algicola]